MNAQKVKLPEGRDLNTKRALLIALSAGASTAPGGLCIVS